MMTQGNRSLHVSGAKFTSDIQMDTNATTAIQHLKKELQKYQTENKNLTDQLNCLVSLIKRSWSGDKHAIVHLSNITGIEPPPNLDPGYRLHSSGGDGTIARPNSQANPSSPPIKTRCERNWERFAMKLLAREYQAVENEIRQYQQRYIENRGAYMDAVLQDHQQSMSRVQLHRKTEPAALEQVDSKFIKHTKAMKRMGAEVKPISGYRRVQSAGPRRKIPVQDRVEAMDISLRDLVGEPASSEHMVSGKAMGEPRIMTSTIHQQHMLSRSRQPPPNTYNDPGRYLHGDIFSASDVGGKKSRPISASSLREGDAIRARPRSGKSIAGLGPEAREEAVFITQKNERPLKYETTKPVSGKPKSALKHRRHSTGGKSDNKHISENKTRMQPQTDLIHAAGKTLNAAQNHDGTDDYRGSNSDAHYEDVSNEEHHYQGRMDDKRGQEAELSDEELDPAMFSKPPVVRVKSAFTRRPAYIDEFANDQKAMKDMEADFRRTAISLQKKLGIVDDGVVTFD